MPLCAVLMTSQPPQRTPRYRIQERRPINSRAPRRRPYAFKLCRRTGWRYRDRKAGDEMGKVIVMNWVTLDGVMQGPGRPDEDTRDGFERGGWGIPYGDEATVAKMGERMGGDRAFLFGRRTYEQLLASWNARGGSFKDALNNTRKYVASSNPATRLDWPNSTLLHWDAPAAVADLKQGSSANLVIMGSGVLI